MPKNSDKIRKEVLRSIIEKYGSQKAVADRLGISEAAVSKALNKEEPSLKFLHALKGIGITFDDSIVQISDNKIGNDSEMIISNLAKAKAKFEEVHNHNGGGINERFVDKLIEGYEVRILSLLKENEGLKKEIEKLKGRLSRKKDPL